MVALDQTLTLWINGLHTPFFDQFFFLFSEKLVWIALYLSIIYSIIRREKRQGWWVVLAMVLMIVLSDQVSSSVLKPLVERLRPTHDPSMCGKIHTVNDYVGGLYGFVSSHAANSAALALFLILWTRSRLVTFTFIGWACTMAYSRVYLGVHFAGDVLCGALVGVFSAIVAFKLLKYIGLKKSLSFKSTPYSFSETSAIVFVFVLTIIFLLVKSV